MTKRARRSLIALLLAAGCTNKPVESPKTCGDVVTELARAAKPLDDDAVIAAVGDARVVALGDADPGDGAGLALKARLVRALHDRAGFDVLAFEASLWDVHRLENELRKGTKVDEAAHEAFLPSLASDPSLQEMVGWAKSQLDSAHAVRLAGLDPQFTGDHHELPFVRMLREAMSKCAFVPEPLVGRLEAAFKRFPNQMSDHEVRDDDAKSYDELRALLKQNQAAFVGVVGMSEAPFVMRTLDSIMGLYEWHHAIGSGPGDIDWKHIAVNNVRDRLMAENVAWLRAQLPGRKIILWGATSHLVKQVAPTQPTSFDLAGYEPLGAFLAKDETARYYVLGVTCDSGRSGRGAAGKDVAPSPPGSLEASLRAGGKLSLIDLHLDLARDCPFVARPIGHLPLALVWSKSLDGMLYLEKMSSD